MFESASALKKESGQAAEMASLLDTGENSSGLDWAYKNVLNPALNAGAIESINALGNVINKASRTVSGSDIAGKVGHMEVPASEFLSPTWLVQSVSSGLGMAVPYLLAGKLAGGALRTAGASFGAEGATAKFLQSQATASIAGAAAFDFVRDTRVNETHTGNALAGAAAFGVFEFGNRLAGNSLTGASKILARALTGAGGATIGLTVSRQMATGELPTLQEYSQAAITGGIMNNALPPLQSKLAELGDHANLTLGRGISVNRFKGHSSILDQIIEQSPWTRVQTGATTNDFNAAKNRIELTAGPNVPERLARELVRMKLGNELGQQFGIASNLVKQGQLEGAWNQYREARVTQETVAHHAENKVSFELGKATSVIERRHLAEEIGAWPAPGGMSQERRWRFEFTDFVSSEGKFRPGMAMRSREAFDPDTVRRNPAAPSLQIQPGTSDARFREIATKAVADLQGLNAIALNAGGSVRDELMGKAPKDYDIATSASPDAVEKLFRDQGHKVLTVGKQFGTIKVIIDGYTIEVTTLRNDGNYTDGRRPDSVTFSNTLRDDAARRDLTINAIFKDPLTNTYYDLFGGRKDIANKLIRTVGDPHARFAEDNLRMMRVARFASRYDGFKVEAGTLAAIEKNADGIRKVSFERIRDEFGGIFKTEKPSVGLDIIMKTGLMNRVLPELVETNGPKGAQDPKWHPEGNTWEHTKRVVDNLAAQGNGAQFDLMFAGLIHDIGKPGTQKIWPDGGISNKKHDVLGAEMAKPIIERFKLSNQEGNTIHELSRWHMQMHDVRQMRQSTLWQVLKRPDIMKAIELQHADSLGTAFPGRFERSNRQFLLDKIDALKNAEIPSQRLDAAPLVDGKMLIDLKLPASPIRGQIISAARLAQQEGSFTTIDAGKDWVRQNYPQYFN